MSAAPHRIDEQRLDLGSLRRFALATGWTDAELARDAPALAHWAWFPDVVAGPDVGPDGHPRPGPLLPETGKPRRMFAAGSIAFVAPLHIDAPARIEERVVEQRTRSGRSGELVFVELEQRILHAGSAVVVEQRTLVYRDPDPPVTLPAPAEVDKDAWWPGEAELFRFSAATFNAHRIHYDRDYARNIEGYPDPVVQGPLTAARLADLAAKQGPLATFAFRAEAPLFVNQPVRLVEEGDSAFAAIRCDGVTAMRATVTWKA